MNRATLILLLIALPLIIAAYLAGDAAGRFFLVLFTDGLLALSWVVAAALLGAWILQRFNFPTANSLGVATAAGLGLGIYSLAALGLGLIGWLNRWTALFLPAISLLLFFMALLRRYGNRTLDDALANARTWLKQRWRGGWIWLLTTPFLGIALFGAALPPIFLWKNAGDPHPYDVLEYHLEVPREWYQLGKIVPLHHNVYNYFPFNVEMQHLLTMHVAGGPWAAMYTAQFTSLAYMMLTVLAIYGSSRLLMEEGDSPFGPMLGAVAAASVPWLTMLGCVAYNECGLLLYGTLAISCTIKALTPALSLRERGWNYSLILAGVMAGFACGVKYTAVPTLLIAISLLIFFLPLPKGEGRGEGRATFTAESLFNSFKAAIVFFVAGMICLSPWLIRNYHWTGNPVFPEAMNLFGRAHFSESQQIRWEHAHAPRPDQRNLTARAKAFWNEILKDQRYGIALWPLAVVAALVFRNRRVVIFLSGLLMIQIVFWLFFTHLQSRFFILGITIAAILIGQPIRGRAMQKFMCGVVLLSAGGSIATLSGALEGERYFPGDIGVQELALEPGLTRQIDAGATLDLIGEAQAFAYDMPIQNLRYRTAFDVDAKSGQFLSKVWLGENSFRPASDSHINLVNPYELERFLKTYRWPPGVKLIEPGRNYQGP